MMMNRDAPPTIIVAHGWVGFDFVVVFLVFVLG
jgi:hypothetical protein